ncbi:hypothetical protein [Desertivirga arenae]|uniref:hypothetical protein n=1 Tax=Desertivirga arenae TaxID=2810309 RepID=UPI001A978C2D|nr:hypothetical protein [Pedobacter sp. SYSU D00823]
MGHSFHIPVLGLGFSVDTPLKVARYGISSVASIVDDEMIERMREFHSKQNNIDYHPIRKVEMDHRAKRVKAYLNLVNMLIESQHSELKQEPFVEGSDICRYFELLPESCQEQQVYKEMQFETDPQKKEELQNLLRTFIKKGDAEVNIMVKVDKVNLGKDGFPLGDKFTDALAALRGFAESELNTSVVLSAGMNPKLYTYLSEFEDFFPSADKQAKKKVILKVSDFRSALIQAKFLAKKGLWVHEFRIESGLNCGGHAFATEGYLLGPILEEFKEKRPSMLEDLYGIYKNAIVAKTGSEPRQPSTRFTVQGGIGTKAEDEFLRDYYKLDGTGWGSPFLLVPEVTNVDRDTLDLLKNAVERDFYISAASPLGVPFNNFSKSTAEALRLERIAKGRPGSPCTKKFLVSNTEFTSDPICTASREYQKLKLEELDKLDLPENEYKRRFNNITEKLCLCVGLCTSAILKNDMLKPRENRAVAICPGPNTAYFNDIYTLNELVGHIYGRTDLLKDIKRPNLFIKELHLYVDYLKKDIENNEGNLNDKKLKQLENFRSELLRGIAYYRSLLPQIPFADKYQMDIELSTFQNQLEALNISQSAEV